MSKKKKGKSLNDHLILLLVAVFVVDLVIVSKIIDTSLISKKESKIEEYLANHIVAVSTLTPTPTPTEIPTPTLTLVPTVYQNTDPWGVAKQINEHTWTIKVGQDERMATPQEIYEALNIYRERNGVKRLNWSGELASYAQVRADFFNNEGDLDGHRGFNEYTDNIDNLKKLSHWWVGENSSIGYRVLGVHLIEWIYAGDKPHDDNQRNPNWEAVGVGVSGTATDIIFGAKGM